MLELFREEDLWSPGGAGPSCQFDVSRSFAWLSLGVQVVDDSVMLCGLPSGVVPGYLQSRYFP